METQLKQRLTGAIILVVLAVLIVPELLTGPKVPAAAGSAPIDAAPVRSYTIDLTGTKPPSVTRDVGNPLPIVPAADPTPPALPTGASGKRATAATHEVAVAQPPPSAPAAAAPMAPAPPTVAQGFAVQLGSFANRATAAQIAKELQSAGFPVSIAPVRAGGRDLLRVRVGPVADRAQAETLLKKLAATGHKGPIVPFP